MLDYKKIIGLIIAGISGFAAIVFAIFGIYKLTSSSSAPGPVADSSEAPLAPVATPEKIDLQLPVNQWLDSISSRDSAAILVYDLDNSTVVARHRDDETMAMEQLYQLFIAYEGYYRLASGEWDENTGYSDLSENHATCLDRMLRWSDVACSDAMWNEIGHDNLQSIFESRNFSTKIASFRSTAFEISTLLQLYYNHPNFTTDTYLSILDSLLNQKDSPTFDGQNLRQGLPSGFTVADVYNKAGWLKASGDKWTFYDDAAIVVFPETTNKSGKTVPERHYIVTVLTAGLTPQDIVTLGRNLESAIRTADSY